jgi:uncharacterized lipoprotein YddW (UPF0748 family)
MREFRGVWVATVENIDWPSKRGLPVARQQAELLAILDKAAQLHLNAVLLQVRPACDALYASDLEPWSEYLTGTQGQGPQPTYDPLAFAVEEAHKRGLELHAWFNPYRARHPSAKSAPASNHVSRTHPEIVRRYAGQMWLDPGEEATQAHSLAVVMDVVRRYDIDGVHIDDYFYPYPENDSKGHEIPFPDDTSYHRYRADGGTLDRSDWRRNNVDRFIERLYKAIKEAKPWVKFGVSPFGIWRPGYPAQIKGYDAYNRIYCDARKWLQEGWLDYLTPQLYWKIEQTPQSFPVLLNWWIEQNAHGRHIWPGSYTSMVGDEGGKRHWPASEILYQIRVARGNAGAQGDVQFSMKALMQNADGLADRLLKEVYTEPALVPASPWLGGEAPSKPVLSVDPPADGAIQVAWYGNDSDHVWQWALQWRIGGVWHTQILSASELSTRFPTTPGARPDAIAVSSVDRYGNQSIPAVVDLTMMPQ